MKSLRVRMTITIVLVVVLSIGLLSFMSYRRARNSMSSQMEANYSIAADKYAQELTAWVNSNATLIDTLATEISVSGISATDYDTMHAYLKATCDDLNDEGYIYDIYFTYPNNTMACASDFQTDGTVDYVHDRDWYTVAVETGDLFYSNPYMDSDTGEPVITISKAVYSHNADGTTGELAGVLAADIFVTTLVDIINDADVAENSYAFLIDDEMEMIVHPNEAYKFDDDPLGVMEVEGAPYQEVINNIKSGSNETVYVHDYDDVERGIVVSKMSSTGWYVGIATDKNILLSSISGLMRGFIIAALIAVIIGGTIAVALAQVLEKYRRQQTEYEEQVLKLEKQAADEASKAKSRFLADMSHEIRTPINAILGMNEMILRESDNRDVRGYSANIKNSGHTLLQLINNILDFSKIEDGKMEIINVRYSVGSQITYLVNSISERARAKGLELELFIDPEMPSELIGDDTRLNEVIMNLLTNAVKYTDKGKVKLTISERVRRLEPDKAVMLYVEVSDTGIGIKESDMEKLFESFERLDTVRNRNVEGTGLGMSITTKLLALMGSELKVKSTYGEGSTFSFEVWQGIASDKPLGDYRKAAEPEETAADVYRESFHAPDAHILIVDDTQMNILVAVNLLKRTGIQIDTANSGVEAIRMATQNKYDMILMDQRMPGMDGTEALHQIRALNNRKNADTPVICLTADVIRGAKDRYIAQGFNDYLTKPVDGHELESMLIEYIPEEKIVLLDDAYWESVAAASGSGSDGDGVDGNVDPANVIAPPEPADSISSAKREALYAELSEAGVNTYTGLTHCQHDESMYISILVEYARDAHSKLDLLQDCFDRRDWKDYCIHIHSIKSSSRTIGATALADIASTLEAASNCDDTDTIVRGHSKIVVLYRKLAFMIVSTLDLDVHDDEDDGDDEVMEFLPNEE